MNKPNEANASKKSSNAINHLPPKCACRSTDKSRNIFTDGEFIFGPYNFDLFANDFYQFDEFDDNSNNSGNCAKFPNFHDSPPFHELSNSANSVPISACHARHAEPTDELLANQSRTEITGAGDRPQCVNCPNDRRGRSVPIELNVIEELDELKDDEVDFKDGKVRKVSGDGSIENRESSVDSKTGKIKDIFDDLYFDLYVVEPEIKQGLVLFWNGR